MKEATAVVENGQIKLPPDLNLPDGLRVKILWDGDDVGVPPPYEREMLTEEDIRADLEWATGKRFPR